MSKIVKSQIESNSQLVRSVRRITGRCVKDRQITNWKQFTTTDLTFEERGQGVSKIVKSQIESNSQQKWKVTEWRRRCVKDRQITNWKQFTTYSTGVCAMRLVCQRSSNHKLKAIHNFYLTLKKCTAGVSKIVKSQIESNSQRTILRRLRELRCVKDRQITNWKQFTTM